MAWQATPYALPSLVSAVISVSLIVYVWRHREEPLAKAFLVLMATIAAWSIAYAIQLLHTTLAGQLLWQRLGLSIGAAIPTIWLMFTLVYAGEEHRLTRRVVALLLVDPVSFALLAWTNGSHGLLWSSAELAPGLGLDLTFSPVYLLHISYAYLLVVIGVGLLLAVFVRSSAIYRRQAGLLVLGAVVPLLANVAFTLGVSPLPGLDLTTPTFALTGVVFALGLFRFDFLDLTPVARRLVLDEFGSGVLVVDRAGRVVHANDTARDVLTEVTVGDPVTELLSVRDVDEVDGLVSEAEVDGSRRYHEFGVSTLRDFRGRLVGHVIALKDVTTNIEYEQRLEVANRLLRHNLRNDMNKVLAWTKAAREGPEEESRAALDRIDAVAQDVAELSQKSTQIETTLRAREEELVEVDLVGTVESVVDEVHQVWPDAELSLSSPESAAVQAPDDGLLATAVRNVVENGVEHSDRTRPRVSIEIAEDTDTDGRWVTVSVADDGPGIPAIEREALRTGRETALEHGSGLGLWLVRWITQTAGGDLEFGDNDPRGSVVTMRLRPARG